MCIILGDFQEYPDEEDGSRRRRRDRYDPTPEARSVEVKRRHSVSPEVTSKRARVVCEGSTYNSSLLYISAAFKA